LEVDKAILKFTTKYRQKKSLLIVYFCLKLFDERTNY
jgi:hypothetical protein